MFLSFVNFYKRFIYRYFKIAKFLINLFKNNKNKKKLSFFEYFKSAKLTFRYFRNIFIFASFLIYYNFKKTCKFKIDFSNFAIVDIFS